jgi:hypothetical protein
MKAGISTHNIVGRINIGIKICFVAKIDFISFLAMIRTILLFIIFPPHFKIDGFQAYIFNGCRMYPRFL